ncbi:MAG TPA: AMP-binding protein [Spirochaetales bacterium]|nr:AMP-binding protein [Spirochaetales bacterium]HRY53766.1 AMP-binding protein [Spirochaetia bacterium]HRZ65595.1 AMP-binding protein [Spirochaetia bacterium]
MKRTVLRMIDEAALAWAEDPYALRKTDSGYIPLTFEQARERSREFAAWLLSRGWGRGDNLAILAEGSPEWIVGECGMLMAGCVSVPLSIKLLGEELPFRLNHSEARAILTTRNQLEKVLGSFKEVADKSILVVYLDEELDEARLAAAKLGIGAERVVGFAEALAAGRAALAAPGSALGARLDSIAAACDEDDVATICYTSGTTGNPKGIMLTHLNYWTNCHDAVELFDNPIRFRTLLVLPVDHSFAHTVGLYTALVCGIALYFVDSRGGGIATLRNIPINLKESKPIFLFTVPALSGNFMKKIVAGIEEKGGFVERLFKRGIAAGIAYNGDGYTRPSPAVRASAFLPYKLAKALVFDKVRKLVFGESLRFCVGGGALLDVKQQEFFAAFGLPVYQGYGLTEAAPIISSNTPRKHKFGTSGILAPSVECRLLRPDGSEAAVGENGEIVIRGGNVMKGYYKNPEATAAALRGGWLHTGDLAHWDRDGFLVVVGREKALLIAEDGEKYSPEEIEEAVTFSTGVIDQIMVWCEQRKYAAALVTLDAAKVERLLKERGVAEARVALELLKDEFYAFRSDPKAKKVQAAWIPAVFQIVPRPFGEKQGEVNSTMKLVRHRVAELHRGLIDYSYTSEGSSTINERNLAALRELFKLA